MFMSFAAGDFFWHHQRGVIAHAVAEMLILKPAHSYQPLTKMFK